MRRKTLSIRAAHRICTGFPQWEIQTDAGDRVEERRFSAALAANPAGALAPARISTARNDMAFRLTGAAFQRASFSGRARAEDKKLKELTFGGSLL